MSVAQWALGVVLYCGIGLGVAAIADEDGATRTTAWLVGAIWPIYGIACLTAGILTTITEKK